MLNEFLKTVQDGLVQQLAGKTDVDKGKLDSVAKVVTDTFKTGLLDKATSGNLSDIMGLAGKGGSSSPFGTKLVNDTVANLVSKLGLPKGISDTIATIAVPFIIDKFGDLTSGKGNTGEPGKSGVEDILGDLMKGSLKDSILGGLGKKFGF